MKYSPYIYVRVLKEAFSEAPASAHTDIVRSFLAVIKKNGDWNKIENVVRKYQESLVRDEGGRVIRIEFARLQEEKIVSQIKKLFTPRDHFEVQVNPALIAGIRLTIDGEYEFDASLTHKLSKMFHKV